MCGLCGAYRKIPHWSDPVVGVESRRQRLDKATFINSIVSTVGIRIRDFCGASYTINNRKGKSVISYTPDDLWFQIDKLAESDLDPLDSGLIARLVDQNGH